MKKDIEKDIKGIFKDFSMKILNAQKQLLNIKENIEKREYQAKLKKIKD